MRFRDRAANSLIDNSTIQWCGMLGQGNDVDQYKYHNAEGVYIGTSPKSTDQPLYANDTSNNIVVRNSTINTYGSECFEVKENAHHNRMENVDCGYNDEPSTFQGSNVELRGDHNTVLASRLYNSRSWNMKLASDSSTYDKGGNTAQGTSFSGAATYGIINRQTGSGPFCGDTFTGQVSDPSGNSVGTPTATCAGSTTPTVTAKTPAAGATGVAGYDQRHRDVLRGRAERQRHDVHAQGRFGRRHRDGELRRHQPGRDVDAVGRPGREHAVHGHADRGCVRHQGRDRHPAGDRVLGLHHGGTLPRRTHPADGDRQSPAADATGVQAATTVTATFSEALALQVVSGSTFTLKPGTATSTAANVAANVTYDATSRVATLTPSAPLAANTQYTATLTGGATAIRDAAEQPAGDRFLDLHHGGRLHPDGHHRADGDHAVPESTLPPRQPHGEHHGHLQRGRHRCQRRHVQSEERPPAPRAHRIAATVSYNGSTTRVRPSTRARPSRRGRPVHRHRSPAEPARSKTARATR